MRRSLFPSTVLPLLLLTGAPAVADTRAASTGGETAILAPGDPYAFGAGHRLRLHAAEPARTGTVEGFGGAEQERTGTVARLEACAGEEPLWLQAYDFRRFREVRTRAHAPGQSETVYSTPTQNGLETPLFDFADPIPAGECHTGWIDFVESGWASGDQEVLALAIAYSQEGNWDDGTHNAAALWRIIPAQ